MIMAHSPHRTKQVNEQYTMATYGKDGYTDANEAAIDVECVEG